MSHLIVDDVRLADRLDGADDAPLNIAVTANYYNS